MKCIVTIVPGGVVEVDAPDGCTVLDVVRQAFPDVDLSSFSIFHGKEKLTLEQAAATTLSVQRVVLAEAIIGHAPTPTMRRAIQYLQSQGYTQSSGKGDHIKFKSPGRRSITLNPAKRDAKHLDLASAKQFARSIGVSLADLNCEIESKLAPKKELKAIPRKATL